MKSYLTTKNIIIIFIILLSFTTKSNSDEKNITYMQILQNPNDLDLNLKYAQQQGKIGNHKQTISTLERLCCILKILRSSYIYFLS